MCFSWILWFPLFFGATRAGFEACTCGYGGPCLRFIDGSPYNFPCQLCDRFSRGYYNSCTTITDHCQSSPCARGRCVPTFGAYYCDCPKDYFGKNCDIFNPFYSSVGISNEINAYHQFQPDFDGMSWFDIIYDPKDKKTWEAYGIEIRVNVTLGDGRRYFPLRDEHFKKINVREMCLEKSKSETNAYDARVCDLLPEGKKWTYSVDTTLYAFGLVNYEDFKAPEVGSIADLSMMTLQIQVITNNTRDILYEHNYPVFSYEPNPWFDPRIPHRCKLVIDFRECSIDKRYPWLAVPGDPLLVKAIHRSLSCKGVTYLGSSWYMQRNIDRIVRATVPVAYVYTLSELHTVCWIEVVRAHPNLGFAKGNRWYATCYRPFTLEAVSFDTNYSPADYQFYVWCDVEENNECKYRRLPGSTFVLYRTPCGESYRVFMNAEHRQNLSAPANLTAEVKFVRTEVNLFIECLHNCRPINPEFRTVMAAGTEVYSPGPVSWQITVDSQPVDRSMLSFGGDINSLDGTSRVVRLQRRIFKSLTQPTAKVTYNVSKGNFGFCEYETEAINLEYYIKDFKLIDLKDGRYKFVHPKANGSDQAIFSRIFYPTNYWIYSIDTTLGECFIEVDSYHESLLTFRPHYDTVQLCLYSPVQTAKTEICTSFLDVKVNSYSRLSLRKLQALFETGDTRPFLSQTAYHVISDLKQFGPNTLQWTMSLEDRELIVEMYKKVKLYIQADYLLALSLINSFIYSNAGCKDQGFVRKCIDETYSKFERESRLLKLRNWAISWLKVVVGLFAASFKSAGFKLRRYPFGYLTTKAKK